jgi:hypothetical protein
MIQPTLAKTYFDFSFHSRHDPKMLDQSEKI